MYNLRDKIGNRNDICSQLIFPCGNLQQIHDAIDRVEILIEFMSLSKKWVRLKDSKQAYLEVNRIYSLVFHLTKDCHVHTIAVYGPNKSRSYYSTKLNGKNIGEALLVINQFGTLI